MNLGEKHFRNYRRAMDEALKRGKYINIPYCRKIKKVGRNDPCPCKSGKKYKKCCGL